jgi:hypothetical protein
VLHAGNQETNVDQSCGLPGNGAVSAIKGEQINYERGHQAFGLSLDPRHLRRSDDWLHL